MEYLFLNGMGSCQPIVGIQSQTYFCACLELQSVDGLACVEWTFPQRCFKEQRVVMFLGP